MIYDTNLVHIVPADQISIVFTRFDVSPLDQSDNIKINGPCN